MKQIVLGTAGHIDHGKTSLIKALTGIETDRLKEEKARGITIELGFASMVLPGGQRLGIVDVPGHEKFVKNMVAGVTGIDMVAMVIAADEGVMPQTREHMEICSLLGVRFGLVVLTKVDMVDEEWLELVTEDIRAFVADSFLEGAPIVPVSSLTGQGLPELMAALDALAARVPERTSSGLFRLPVDRVFTMKGFGTVITGTVASGSIRVGDSIMIYPSGITSKVRGIQVHNAATEEAGAAMRTAINFQGLEKAAINRGDVVSVPDGLRNSHLLDARMHYLKSNKRPLKNRTRIRMHTGTCEIMGNLILLEKETLDPGETTVVQIRLESPMACVKDDRFVIRSYSPVRTIAGGEILNPFPQKHKRFKSEIVDGLKGLLENDLADAIAFHASQAGYHGLTFGELKLMTNMPEKKLTTAVSNFLSQKVLIQTDKETRTYIHGEAFGRLNQTARDYLARYHEANPLKEGMSKGELKSKFPPDLGVKLYNLIINHLLGDGTLVQEGDLVRLSSHTVALKVDQEELKEKILSAYKDSAHTPPYFKTLAEELGASPAQAKDVLMLLVNEKSLVKIKEDLYFYSEALAEIQTRLVDYLTAHQDISAPQFKDLTGGLARKYLIPLLEYFDMKNITIRVGDTRQLRNR
ncbi:selenocysteine-specific translation elongation factor [Desulfatiferula olefinivorans]